VEGGAIIIPFPGVKLEDVLPNFKTFTCGDCIHAYLGADGVFCGEYREMIYNESVANTCESYEE
jgi:hypothetical protein